MPFLHRPSRFDWAMIGLGAILWGVCIIFGRCPCDKPCPSCTIPESDTNNYLASISGYWNVSGGDLTFQGQEAPYPYIGTTGFVRVAYLSIYCNSNIWTAIVSGDGTNGAQTFIGCGLTGIWRNVTSTGLSLVVDCVEPP